MLPFCLRISPHQTPALGQPRTTARSHGAWPCIGHTPQLPISACTRLQLPSAPSAAISAALRTMCCHLNCPPHHVLPSQLPSAPSAAISAALRTMYCHLSCPPHQVLPSQLPSAPCIAISAALRTKCCHLSCPPHHVLPSQLSVIDSNPAFVQTPGFSSVCYSA